MNLINREVHAKNKIIIIVLILIIILASIIYCDKIITNNKSRKAVDELWGRFGKNYYRTSWYYVKENETSYDYTKITFVNKKTVHYINAVKKDENSEVIIQEKDFNYKENNNEFIIKINNGELKCKKDMDGIGLNCDDYGKMNRSCTMKLPNLVDSTDNNWSDNYHITNRAFSVFDSGTLKTDIVYHFKQFGKLAYNIHSEYKMNNKNDIIDEENNMGFNFEWFTENSDIIVSNAESCHTYELLKESDEDHFLKFSYDNVKKTLYDGITTLSEISYKEIPLEFFTNGHMGTGYSIDTITPSKSSLFIYSNENTLKKVKKVNSYFKEISFKKNVTLTDFTYKLELTDGTTIKLYDSNILYDFSEKPEVNILVSPSSKKYFTNVPIKVIGLDTKKYTYSISNSSVDVVVEGTKSVLDNIDSSNILVYVKADKNMVGGYPVDIIAECDDIRVYVTTRPNWTAAQAQTYLYVSEK